MREERQSYCDGELDKLKKVGNKCVLVGYVPTLRNCVSRYQKKTKRVFFTKKIDGDLHVVLVGVAK